MQDRLKVAQVQVSTVDSDAPPKVETLSLGLEERLNELNEMAATCLLMLHLEVGCPGGFFVSKFRKFLENFSNDDSFAVAFFQRDLAHSARFDLVFFGVCLYLW